ncbi:MAG: hypothetical protein ISN26_04550 [Betaproteobacteria bacterium AqS2]|uniref:Uncharacterized protein n=1 Tax=Candidatus Amphirhobacter heronislandensis TaxID=1732024 RepID=A0A930Y1G5_9GAMM|nr:hypothetical protein [Betaproteobacteria bacterium AqS2]
MKQVVKYLLAFVVGVGAGVIATRNKKQSPKGLDLNEPQDLMTLRALYVIAHDIVHADGREEKRELEMLVDLVRRMLGKPDMDADHIQREYHRHSGMKMEKEDFLELSEDYRKSLFACVLQIVFSGRKFVDKEMKNKLREIAIKLGLLEKEIGARLANIENIEDVGKMIQLLPEPDMYQLACGRLKVASDATREQCIEARFREIKVVLKVEASATDEQCADAYNRLTPYEKAEADSRIREIDEAFSFLTSRIIEEREKGSQE